MQVLVDRDDGTEYMAMHSHSWPGGSSVVDGLTCECPPRPGALRNTVLYPLPPLPEPDVCAEGHDFVRLCRRCSRSKCLVHEHDTIK